MTILDKYNKLSSSLVSDSLYLDLGSGASNKIQPHFITVDAIDSPLIDVTADVYDLFAALPSNCCSGIKSSHLLEHLHDTPLFLRECIRVLKPGATLEVVVPHFSNPFFYSDPTHQRSFGLYTLAYYFKQNLFQRTLPEYSLIPAARLTSIRLSFKSFPPFYIRHLFKYLFQLLVNLSPYFLEFYEEFFVFLFPCYEIHTHIQKERED